MIMIKKEDKKGNIDNESLFLRDFGNYIVSGNFNSPCYINGKIFRLVSTSYNFFLNYTLLPYNIIIVATKAKNGSMMNSEHSEYITRIFAYLF